ncbi:hypothetical protein EUA02_29860 [Mycobacterium paragordonae]|uniref:hypothetical protein n=1 Tax=Mycobacterium paragordonae TaxID=1389713 RepID=UPI00105CA5BE|nr:hypothetical protein [Mycobacterium paragordonae]TDK85467.1 hypothetical protein EUA02_29860 [Mycobacterium paragordonae]TDK98961.1 hypothetical protein EUA05_31125 [Mycobacterium paragordonae]
MAIECQSCTAPAELWICPQCITELRADLLSLAIGPEVAGKPTAGLLDALHDVVTKQTNTGNGNGHRKRGDEMPDPFEPDTERGKPTRQGQASTLLHAARNTLTTIVRDLLGKRKISPDKAFQVVSPKNFIGPLLPGWRRVPNGWQPTTAEVARWLATHVHALACDEGAGVWKRDVGSLVARIKRVIDRPPAPRLCGQCDHMNDRKMCGLMLRAHPDAIEVTCPVCHTTHNIERLYNRWLNTVDYQIVSREVLIGNQRAANPELHNTGILGALDEKVTWQTFNRWVRDRHVKPVRYLRPNGRRGFFRHGPEDVPEYRVGDVRQVNRRMAQRNPVKSGAGAG